MYWLKDATKHILYNKANSNIMQGVAPGAHVVTSTAPWRIGMYVGWGVVGLFSVLDLAYIAIVATDKVKVKEKAVKETESGEEY